jgi:hypothetical protein
MGDRRFALAADAAIRSARSNDLKSLEIASAAWRPGQICGQKADEQ